MVDRPPKSKDWADVEYPGWGKRYVRLSEPFLLFFPIWFTVCFFVGASLWLRFEVNMAQYNSIPPGMAEMCAQHPEWKGVGYC